MAPKDCRRLRLEDCKVKVSPSCVVTVCISKPRTSVVGGFLICGIQVQSPAAAVGIEAGAGEMAGG